MTEKEKAKKLLDKYLNIEDTLGANERGLLFLEEAKQCAVICVDEIINTGINQDYIKQDGYMLSLVEFYEEVKQEINKL
jgi:hypothetical protein